MLTIITLRNVNNYSSRTVGKCDFPNITFRNIGNHIFRNAGDICQQLFVRRWRRTLAFITFRNVSNYSFQKCWRQMLLSNYNVQKCQRWRLAIRFLRNAGDKCYQLKNPEMLATNVSKYNVQKSWRQTLTNTIPQNTDNNNYNYNFCRAPWLL